jgi:TonB family protein
LGNLDMKKLLAALFALFPCAAIAGTIQQSDTSGPVSTGLPHQCNAEMQAWAELMVAKGEKTATRMVQVRFRVATDGSVKDPAVALSSDDADADKMATTCVAGWRYRPAMQANQAVEVDWKANVNFRLGRTAVLWGADFDTPASDAANQVCEVLSPQKLEQNWSSTTPYLGASGANDSFECIGGGIRVCRAKPGNPLYPTNVAVLPLSTGSKTKLSVTVQTSGNCSAAYPLTFKDGIPSR